MGYHRTTGATKRFPFSLFSIGALVMIVLQWVITEPMAPPSRSISCLSPTSVWHYQSPSEKAHILADQSCHAAYLFKQVSNFIEDS